MDTDLEFCCLIPVPKCLNFSYDVPLLPERPYLGPRGSTAQVKQVSKCAKYVAAYLLTRIMARIYMYQLSAEERRRNPPNGFRIVRQM